jgi:SpoIID/LytB domain protein
VNRSLAGGFLVVVLAATSPLARQSANLDLAAWRVIDLASGRAVDQARGDRLGRPGPPGSFMKLPALIAALASRTISPDTRVTCQGQTTIDGRVIRCSHPRVRHALRAAEALALSCNVYFATVSQRLPRPRLDRVLTALGLPPTPARASMSLAATGLEGTATSPAALLAALSRFVLDPAVVPLDAAARQAVLDGLRGSAVYGTSSAFALRGVAAYAKTGTSEASGGGVQGLVVAVWPAGAPARGIVLLAPGAAGMDAADLAAQVASGRSGGHSSVVPSVPASKGSAPGEVTGIVLRIGTPKREGGYAVERVPLDEYVARVLGGEAAPRSGVAALEALAITARTFALANTGRHQREGFDLCTLTHCQVLRDPTPAMRAAVASTAGRVLEWRDRPAQVFYTASCGGYSERPSAVWPRSDDPPFLRAHRDSACGGEPRWAAEISARDLERALRGAGFRGALRDVARAGRTGSGRVARLKLAGLAPDVIAATDFRTLIGRTLGWHLIKSTDFTVRRRSAGFYFEGHGFGHGVGLCVLGSVRRAEHGDSATDILKAYFPGLKVASVARLRVSPPTPAEAAPPAIASGEPVELDQPVEPDQPDKPDQPVVGQVGQVGRVRPAPVRFVLVLPPSAEPDRAAIGALVDRALDRVATAAGRPVPVGLRIVFHPSVASFQRETGESWWSAARTREVRIDLQPPEALRLRGTLETTLRHELAHVIIAPVVTGRSEWVGEGAAMHFAGEPPPQSLIGSDGIPRRVHCPSDQEMRRPASAALARQAYGLAAACFERALVEHDGKWEEVR